jgi:hypothetical protein
MPNTDSHSNDRSLALWWLLLVLGIVGSIALAIVLLHDRNQAEMHLGEGMTVAAPRTGH